MQGSQRFPSLLSKQILGGCRALAVLACVSAAGVLAQSGGSGPGPNYNWPTTYTNPLTLTTSSGPAVSCPDPAVIKQRAQGTDNWYLYCTGDALNSGDVNADGSFDHAVSLL